MFRFVAHLISRYPRWVLFAWFILFVAALPLAARVGTVLTAQPGSPPGSVAAQVTEIQDINFSNQGEYSVILITRSNESKVGDEAFNQAYTAVIDDLTRRDLLSSVQDYRNTTVLPLIADDLTYVISLLNLNAQTVGEAKLAVDAIREALAEHDSLTFNLAGGAATTRELEEVSEKDARRAELFGLPLSLIVLVVAFGALVASGLPLIAAFTSIVLSFALLYLLGQLVPFAIFTQSIVTMLGLATGIDYSLLIVNRFREELRKDADARAAAHRTALTAGKAVAFSGLTVMIALAALLVPPLNFIRSIGVGTIVVLFVSVIVAMTAIPATLALLGHRINWLKVSRREPGLRSRRYWRERANRILQRPWLYALTGIIILLLLAIPALKMQVADPGAKGLADSTDAHKAIVALEAVGLEGLLNSFDIMVKFDERGFFYPSHVRDISQFTRELESLDFVDGVYSAMSVDGVPRLLLYQYYATRENALGSELAPLVEGTISDDDRYALVQVYPVSNITPHEGRLLRDEINAIAADVGVDVLVGGNFVREAEWTNVLYESFPLAVSLVYLATLILLGLAFRSLVIPLKSIVLNTLTVGAAFGVITLIFQYGYGSALFGLSEGLGFVDNSAPIFIFAIVFGLSMDYEVFLVARIYEAHKRGLSDRDTVTEALAATGGVITSAATVMIVVFSLFIFSEVVLVKTLGLGLTVAILLDATLVRVALVPAVMTLAGRWNWWFPAPMAKLADRFGLDHD